MCLFVGVYVLCWGGVCLVLLSFDRVLIIGYIASCLE